METHERTPLHGHGNDIRVLGIPPILVSRRPFGHKGILLRQPGDGDGGGGGSTVQAWPSAPGFASLACVDQGDIVVCGGGDKIEGDRFLKIRGHVVSLDTIGGATEEEEENIVVIIVLAAMSERLIDYQPSFVHRRHRQKRHTRSRYRSSRPRRHRRVCRRGFVAVPSRTMPTTMRRSTILIRRSASWLAPSTTNGSSMSGPRWPSSRIVPVPADEVDTDAHPHSRGPSQSRTRSVKSSHGHLVVHAWTSRTIKSGPSLSASETCGTLSPSTPLIDLGGVNGSCDVLLEGCAASVPSLDDDNDDANCDRGSSTTAIPATTTMRVHFDSLSPESISTITSRGVRISEGKRQDLT
ncbi:hypothetical protein ACHAW5_000312 [Stephanodiscus triporus]|uniref:Uncharacterized protein n=1 Tax=Stephanodiscus triporus TaxID=2934178 RepID=A0ABD3MPB0_9STRA